MQKKSKNEENYLKSPDKVNFQEKVTKEIKCLKPRKKISKNLIKQNAKRLGISIIETKILDATKYYKEYEAKFDKILLDVPCLGIGVIKRKPDIKWQRKPEDLQEICKIQEIILENCSKYLKIGGELVYSTCSILEEENENIIKEFVKKNQNFEIKKVKSPIKIFEKFVKKEGYISIKPTEKNDGFFICKLVKK